MKVNITLVSVITF